MIRHLVKMLTITLVVWQSSIDRFLFTRADCCFQ
jgi:hypothetical protein